MSYTINNTNGTIFAVVEDGTIDTSSSVTLVGKNYAGYGEIHNENFLHLLENSASNIEPSTPVAGQLWYDTNNKLLKIYTGTQFKVISSATASLTTPTNSVTGDLWYDTAQKQLKVYDTSSASWAVIGPAYSTATGKSGAIVEVVTDSGSVDHVVVKLYIGGSILAIISKDNTFSPVPAITGFNQIGPGMNLSTSIANLVFNGTATNSQLFDGLDSTDFMRSTSDTYTNGTLEVRNNQGIEVGFNSDFAVSIASGQTLITNQTQNSNILLRVNPNNQITTAITIHGNNANVTVNNNLTVTGDLTVQGDINGIATNVSGIVSIANGGTGTTSSTGTGSVVFSSSPTFSGVPVAPTAAPTTNTTQIATTAFVTNAVSNVATTLGNMSAQSSNNINVTGGTIANTTLTSASLVSGTVNGIAISTFGSNSSGNKTISSSAPAGGVHGDIWYQI